VKKLGSLGGLMSLMPGMPKALKEANATLDDGQVSQVEAIIRSMTRAERAQPTAIDGSRRQRIARGSGTTTQDVNQLLRQFKEAQQLMRSPGMLAGMFGGGGGKLRQALAGQGDDLTDLSSLAGGTTGGSGGAGQLGGLAARSPGATVGGSGQRGGKGRPGAKKKKGGRVTPKADGGGRHR
jgi:signal recognition particle subunit SRP54